jgi:hypothetical protein
MVEQEPSEAGVVPTEVLRAVVKNQYHASLSMLKQAIEKCPDSLWADTRYVNPYWRIVYHTLYFVHLYSRPSMYEFTPWEHHQTGIHDMDDVPAEDDILELTEHPHRPPQTGQPYTKAELLSYWSVCDSMIDEAVNTMEITAAESGFSWYPISKLEHQLVSLRHIQHHTAQLGVLLRSHADVRIEFFGRNRG